MGDLRIKKPTKKSGFVGLLNIPLYHTHVQFYPTQEDAVMDIPNVPALNDGNFGAITFIAEGKDGTWLNVAFREPKYMTAEVIAHEATHAAWFALHMAGVKVSFANHEQLAYLVGYIAEQLHKFCDAYDDYIKDEEEKDGKPTPQDPGLPRAESGRS